MFNYNGIPLRRPDVFDSRDLGTPESYWQVELAGAPAWTLPEGPVVVVAAHPDDETFSCGGLLAMLAAKGNNVQILIYTSDNAGSNEPAMTKERAAEIRRAEEEAACAILGIDKDHITWLGHDDGMLEYVDRRELTKQVVREIRRHRPDAVFSIADKDLKECNK